MGRQRIRKTKKGIIANRKGGFIFLMSFCCFIFVFQVGRFTCRTLLICAFDLHVKLFVKSIGRRGTVIFVCRVIVHLVLTSLYVRGRGCWDARIFLRRCRFALSGRCSDSFKESIRMIIFFLCISFINVFVLSFVWAAG